MTGFGHVSVSLRLLFRIYIHAQISTPCTAFFHPLESVHCVLAKRPFMEVEMEDSTLPPFFEEAEQAETSESRSLDVQSDPELWDNASQDQNSGGKSSDQEYSDQEYSDREYSDQESSDQESSDQASCHDETIPSGELSLIETESDLLCSSSHTPIHPTYIDLRENYVRLLKILPMQADQTIRCHLEEFSLDDKPFYTAISYTWGSQYGSHPIFVNDHSLLVPKNLWRFLNSARTVGGSLSSWLWIDMISINQADISERGRQVNLMPAIFGTADLVNVWLGPAYLGSDAALIALARNNNTWRSPSQRRKIWASHGGPGIRELCQRPYWKRLWVYQELKLARNIQLMCGTKTIAWNQFRIFLSLAETDLSAKLPRLPGLVQDSVDSPAMKMVKLNSESVHTHLWSLIQITQHLRCANTRDKAFALLGACTEGHENVKTDYAMPIPTLINKVLHESYKLYPPESLPEALERCDEVENAFAVPRGTVFTLRGQRGSYEVPSEADIRACKLGPPKSPLNLWWTAFYGHVAVQRLLLHTWRADYFASDYSSFYERRLTWEATAVARDFFETCVVGTLSLDPYLSQIYSSFDSRYKAVEGVLQQNISDWISEDFLPLKECFGGLVNSRSGVAEQFFKILLAPGGFLASRNDEVADLLRAYAVHHDHVHILLKLDEAGFDNNVNESRFLRSALAPKWRSGEHDAFLGIDADKISRQHHERLDSLNHYEFAREQILGMSHSNVVRLPLLAYLASRGNTACLPYFLQRSDCDMDVQDENGWTPLMWAARHAEHGFVTAVLPFCDVNYSDPDGWTAFEHAAVYPHDSAGSDNGVKIMSTILSTNTFDRNAVDSNGCTRLLRAIENCNWSLTHMLLENKGCNPNYHDNEGRTPLTLAVHRCRAGPQFLRLKTVSRMEPNAALPERSNNLILCSGSNCKQGKTRPNTIDSSSYC